MTNKEATKLTLPTTLHQAQNGQREREEKREEGSGRAKPIEAQGNVGFGQEDRPGLAAGQACLD